MADFVVSAAVTIGTTPKQITAVDFGYTTASIMNAVEVRAVAGAPTTINVRFGANDTDLPYAVPTSADPLVISYPVRELYISTDVTLATLSAVAWMVAPV